MRCKKCGNNVISGSSTCPCCGSVVNAKLHANRGVEKATVRTYKQKKVRYTNYTNANSTNLNSGHIRRVADLNKANIPKFDPDKVKLVANLIKIFIIVVVLVPFIFFFIAIHQVFNNISDYEVNDITEDVQYGNETDNTNSNLKNIEVVETIKSKSGDLVFILKNTNDVDVDAMISVEFYDVNKNSVDSERISIGVAAGATQVAVIKHYSVEEYDSYKAFFSVDDEPAWDYGVLDTEKVTFSDNGTVIKASYLNTDEDVSSAQLCMLFYKGEELNNVLCSYDFGITNNTYGEFSFSYYYDMKYNGLEFDTYKLYLSYLRY